MPNVPSPPWAPPEYISDLLKTYSPARALQSKTQDLPSTPYAQTKKYGQQVFAYAAAKLYNDLALNIKKSPTLNSFKNGLKSYLFKQASSL